MVGGKRCIVESDVQRLFDRVRLCVWRGSCPGDLNYSRKGGIFIYRYSLYRWGGLFVDSMI